MDGSSIDIVQLIPLLPPQVQAIVTLLLQLVTIFSVAIPVIEKIVKLTTSKKDDAILERVQRILSVFPRVQIPAVSQRPPAPSVEKLTVQWPSAAARDPRLPPPPPVPANKG